MSLSPSDQLLWLSIHDVIGGEAMRQRTEEGKMVTIFLVELISTLNQIVTDLVFETRTGRHV